MSARPAPEGARGGGCRRCGECCLQGGPALHGPDLELVRGGRLRLDCLVTIRRGELAYPPLGTEPEPVEHEFLKVGGQAGTWACQFYGGASRGCTVYSHRPLACRLLDCAEPGPLLAVAGRDLLTRFVCIAPDDPLRALMRTHEASCPCPDLSRLRRELAVGSASADLLARLEAEVARDLAFRQRVAEEHGLSLGLELFYFGRPLFQLLRPLGLSVVETSTGLRLRLRAA